MLHSFFIIEMDVFPDSLTGGRDDLVVVQHLLALVDERLHSDFAALEDQDRGDFENGLRMEVIGRVGYGNVRIDVLGDDFQDRRFAGHPDVLGHLDHFLVRGARDSGDTHDHGCQQFHSFSHIVR